LKQTAQVGPKTAKAVT